MSSSISELGDTDHSGRGPYSALREPDWEISPFRSDVMRLLLLFHLTSKNVLSCKDATHCAERCRSQREKYDTIPPLKELGSMSGHAGKEEETDGVDGMGVWDRRDLEACTSYL